MNEEQPTGPNPREDYCVECESAPMYRGYDRCERCLRDIWDSLEEDYIRDSKE